jgi:chemotaxis protein CheD
MIEAVKTQEKTILVSLGEWKVAKDPLATLVCLGLGSCISVCVYDPAIKLGGMAHIVLPSSNGRNTETSAKYADKGVRLLLDEMFKQGAMRSHLVVKLAGGAALSKAPGLEETFKIGERNLKSVQTVLAEERISTAAADVGGNSGRTVRMFLDSGQVVVTTLGSRERIL